jgi:amidase
MRRLLKLHGTAQASPGLRLDGTAILSPDFTRLCEEMDAIKSEQLAWFEKYDLIVCPASDRAPIRLDHERPANRPAGASYTSQYNTTGWPAGVVRCGTSTEAAGLPLGIQVVAQPWRDDVVLAALAFIELQNGGWQATPI